jgi:hypothetical protein
MELQQSLRGVIQPFLHAIQSVKEANQPLQDAQNQQIDLNPSKHGIFLSTTKHTKHTNENPFRVFGVFRGQIGFSPQPTTINQ